MSGSIHNNSQRFSSVARLLHLLIVRTYVSAQGVFDPHKYTNVDMCKIHAITYEALMEDEENQVRGYVHFADGVGVSFPHLTLFTPKEAVRIVKNGEVRSNAT